jgi:hypothetical protein
VTPDSGLTTDAILPLLTHSRTPSPPLPAPPPQLFHLPIEEAAKALNIGQTMLKHYCRKFGIPRWPFRKRQSITILVQSIEQFSLNRPVNVSARRRPLYYTHT